MAKQNQLLNQRLNQNKSNVQQQTAPERKSPVAQPNQPLKNDDLTGLKQNGTTGATGFGIRKKTEEKVILKRDKTSKEQKTKTVYTGTSPVNNIPNIPSQGGNTVTQEKDSRMENSTVEKKTGVFRKKESPGSRLQPAQPKNNGVAETEAERIKRLYTEPTLTDASALPRIKEEDEKSYEEELERQSLEASYKKQKKDKRDAVIHKVKTIAVIGFSLYLVFLIYGALMTNYEYKDDGKIGPCLMSVKDIKQQKEFNMMLSYYEEARSIYEDIYMIDYRLSLGKEDPLILATEYEAILEPISSLSVSLSSAEFSSKYSVIQSLLLTWIQDDAALYVQNMSGAISTNNTTSANNALNYRASMYSKFVTITDNVIAIGDSLNGVYTDEIAEWSLDNFIYKQIYGEDEK